MTAFNTKNILFNLIVFFAIIDLIEVVNELRANYQIFRPSNY